MTTKNHLILFRICILQFQNLTCIMSSNIDIKDKSENDKLFKVAEFRQHIRKTEPHKHINYFEIIYLSEGIQKFLFPAIRGAGRFEKIGLPSPEFLGSFVGAFEIVCGALILIGLLTRLASIPSIIIMLVAIASTKSEVLTNQGFWEMMHGSRTDWAMLLGSIFLLIKGSGCWSVDNKLIIKK